MAKVGDRVGCVLSADENTVKILGYGVFEGDKVPPGHVGGFGEALHRMEIPNPCIKLDNGKEVFGCECWWGAEDSMKKMIGDRRVIEVDIDEARAGE